MMEKDLDVSRRIREGAELSPYLHDTQTLLKTVEAMSLENLADYVKNMDPVHVAELIQTLTHTLRERNTQLDRAQKLSMRDDMTGLHNKRYFLEQLERAIAETNRMAEEIGSHPGYVIAFVDMDGLKPINDCLGHQAGDSALKALAQGLQNIMRKEDCLARLSGDEFAMLLNVHEQEHINIDAVRSRFEATMRWQVFKHEGRTYPVRASVGFQEVKPYMSAAQLLNAADQLMYCNKAERGRGRNPGIYELDAFTPTPT